ncbi:MAG TPA: alpha/beta fold hydrolase [Syntrophales bacterium]|nr:alpha/beta fold hydrolase [Syntrophales bacterium]HOX94094.1 alpha/beta fold hydrolase [Syntrophales bacterium]HPI58006.1 alpha/beta fold hydrolase [Syntrophales bacterium]HPN25866.1 alpha/beta fold hydrolase [Syntrophales bacterium]HQM29578.1 alpha/beta fold hydrolase [Syntrophales bacterium]
MLRRLPEDQFVQAGRFRVRYLTVGAIESPVILLHGLGASSDIWMHNIEALALQYRVYAPDLAGFGKSERPETPLTPYAYTQFLYDFMNALGIGKASLVASSFGGAIALLTAVMYPEKVERLVVVGSAGFGREIAWTLRAMSLPLIGEILTYPSRQGVRAFFRQAVYNPAVITSSFVNLYYGYFASPGFREYLLKLVRMMVDIHGVKAELVGPAVWNLRDITQPTLILWGDRDRIIPVELAYFAKKRIRGSELHIFKDCGHIPFYERPEEFNKRTREFLSVSS